MGASPVDGPPIHADKLHLEFGVWDVGTSVFHQSSDVLMINALDNSGHSSIGAHIEVVMLAMANVEQAVKVSTEADHEGIRGIVAPPYRLHGDVVMCSED
ncbi:MAG: hypothetical protein ACI9MC_000356 [Kiritimatiellia bacterium]